MPNYPPEIVQLVIRVIERCPDHESQAKALVAAASTPGSPLAAYFTWDEREAAYQWHLHEAHQLIVRVRVQVEMGTRAPIIVRPLIKTHASEPGYSTFERVVSSPELQESTRERFLHELTLVCKRYSEYGIPQVNALIRVVCRALKLPAPVLFNGADVQRKGVGVG